MSAHVDTHTAPALLIIPQAGSVNIFHVDAAPRWLSVPRVLEPLQEHRGLVAVIEDDVSLNMAILRQLRAAGFRTRSFRSGQEVLAAHGRIADCFVLDVHLPDMTGFELLRQLGTSNSTVVITAHDDPLYRRAAKQIHAIAYLTKPFARKDLLDAVTRALAAS